jgi:mercuric ion transport protein
MGLEKAVAAGSVVGGVLASACCIAPVVVAVLGVSGAGFAHKFEPLRPFLLALTYALLAGAFYLTYRPAVIACGPGDGCERPRRNLAKLMVWIASVVVILATAFPWYAEYLF